MQSVELWPPKRPKNLQYREIMFRSLIPLLAAIALFAASEPDPWVATDLLHPKELADQLRGDGPKPHVFSVAFPVLYRNRHITGSQFAGPGREVAGIDALKEAVKDLPKDSEIVIYCGCCPMDHCPNIRPAFKALKDLGYSKVHVLLLATNFATDWSQKGYPSEPPIQ
jgi:thiosulfate/3-mercaptopyruvate sulfurtransferase